MRKVRVRTLAPVKQAGAVKSVTPRALARLAERAKVVARANPVVGAKLAVKGLAAVKAEALAVWAVQAARRSSTCFS